MKYSDIPSQNYNEKQMVSPNNSFQGRPSARLRLPPVALNSNVRRHVSMEVDEIKEVSIDSSGRLFVQPQSKAFPYIYREAMEVSWDSTAHSLHSPVPREWSHSQWFLQIVSAAKEQGCTLILTSKTHWRNVSVAVKDEIQAVAGSAA